MERLHGKSVMSARPPPGGGVAAVITFAPCTTDRSTPARIASHQGNQSVSCGPVSMVDVIAPPSFDAAIADAAIASDDAAVSDSLDTAIASGGADVPALVASVDDNASISR